MNMPNREREKKIKESKKKWRENNREHILEYAKQYREKHREYIAKYIKQYYQDNKEYCKKHTKQWKEDNREHLIEQKKEYMKGYYQENKDQVKQYQQDNKNSISKYQKEYMKGYYKTPIGRAIRKASRHNRRTLLKDLTTETVQRVYEDNIKQYEVLTCYLCFKPIIKGDKGLKDSLDHSTPLTRKGTNKYKNLGIAHLKCNIKKHTMTLDEWYMQL